LGVKKKNTPLATKQKVVRMKNSGALYWRINKEFIPVIDIISSPAQSGILKEQKIDTIMPPLMTNLIICISAEVVGWKSSVTRKIRAKKLRITPIIVVLCTVIVTSINSSALRDVLKTVNE